MRKADNDRRLTLGIDRNEPSIVESFNEGSAHIGANVSVENPRADTVGGLVVNETLMAARIQDQGERRCQGFIWSYRAW